MRNRLLFSLLLLVGGQALANDGIDGSDIDNLADPHTYNDASYLLIAPNPLVTGQRWTLTATPSLEDLEAALQSRSLVDRTLNPGYYAKSTRATDRVQILALRGRTLYAPPPPDPNWTAVPEPTTAALLIFGFGAFALARRNRKKDEK